MIESREQRRRSSLLHRRKVAIIVFVLVFVILAVTLALLYHFFNSVFYFRDYDETIYYIKKIDGVFAMYDKEGKELPTAIPLGKTDELYITKAETWVDVDPETGDTQIVGIPDLYYQNDGEALNAGNLLIVIKEIPESTIKSIAVSNTHGQYTVVANEDTYVDENGKEQTSRTFVIKESPFIQVNDDAISYITYYAGHIQANKRLDDANKDLSEYGLVDEIRFDEDGNAYNYTPNYYVITTNSGEKHKIIIGDRLLDGSGYYLQYQNSKGETRPAVYVIHPADVSAVSAGMTYESTILGPAKNFLTPALIYSESGTDFYEVQNFTLSHKGEDKPIIDFSYVDIDDRTGTVLGIHPYVFNQTSFSSYNPNHDNIDFMLNSLADPVIPNIAAIGPTDEQKAELGIMSLRVDENGDPILDKNGNKQYYYDSEYLIKFEKVLEDQNTGKEFTITQRIYISKQNENGNYYTYTLITIPDATEADSIGAISIDVINEVSETTLGFLKWDTYDWVYAPFLQLGINYTDKLEIAYGDYSASFKINHDKVGDLSTLGVTASDSKGNSADTFAVLTFTDKEGYSWVITPQRIYVYDKDGNETKPASRRFVYNSIGEQVHIMDSFREAANGDKVYVEKDKIIIQRANGKTDEYLRYYTTIFKKLYANITTMAIVDSYKLSPEEEKALIADESKHIITIKTTDENGKVKTCNFYQLTARKAYIVVDGQGGFYLQTAKLQKLINDMERFFKAEDIDMEAIK